MSRKTPDARRIITLVDSLVGASRSSGVPAHVADEARRVTMARFGTVAPLSPRRVEAYFWGVVRRRALRGGAPAIRQRLILTSFADELAAAGHAPSRIYDELRRIYGGSVDAGLIEAYRPGPAHAA